MDGYTALSSLGGDPATRDIPEPIDPALSFGVGALAHLTTPFSPNAFTKTIRRVLAQGEGP